MTDYGEPWGLKEMGHNQLLCNRDGEIIPFDLQYKHRVITCINFAQGANFDEYFMTNWQDLAERVRTSDYDAETERDNFHQLQQAYQQLMQDFQDLAVGITKMGLNPNALMAAQEENRRNGIE